MSSLFIIVQTRESDKKAVHLLRYLIEKGDVKVGRPLQDLDLNTVMISFQDIQPDAKRRIISDSKQWCDDIGFVLLVNEDSVYSNVSRSGEVEKENATIISMLEL
jgi:hypothetical protein